MERRRRTEKAILVAARRQFGAKGYQGTSIRGVAEEAGIDPALVMQMFGSKEQLFSAAVTPTAELRMLGGARRDELAAVAAAHLFAEFEDVERRANAEVVLRSSLTHPLAGQVLREQVMAPAQAAVAGTIGGEQAELRAAVLNACTLGVTIARYLLEDPVLNAATVEELQNVLQPALAAVIGEGAVAVVNEQ